MKIFHKLQPVEIDLTEAIARHSADVCVAYKSVEDEPIYLGYFLPKNHDRNRRYKTFIFIHGGGWGAHMIFGDQKHWMGDHLGYLARYYADNGMVCVSVDYRLARDFGQQKNYELMNCYDDCCDAIDYVVSHAEDYGIDKEQLYLLGESAGGHLAGAVFAFRHDRQYRFQKVFLVNPITYFGDKWKIRIPKESSHPKLVGLTMQEREAFLSPIFHLDKESNDVVLIHGEIDTVVPLEHSLRFYSRMKELANSCDLHVIEKTNHAFLLAEFVENLVACKKGIEIINSYFTQ